ncbi:hypothetical protein GIB67_026714 [Kingdonia uniflora]|uniref:Kelch repeat-containing protein n=1 Tax=Kingdonia uniflora TaxID=39325 RepID=A0A7J7M275_9MAGN|nr:hypothetical protein GIB67_026714 [Kingdonia uniflora]
MARTPSKQTSSKLKTLLLCAALLGAVLIANFLWASSSSSLSSSYLLTASNWAVVQKTDTSTRILPNSYKRQRGKDGRVLSATFADLDAPELEWEKMASAPVPRLDGAALQIKDLLYVFAGYGTIDIIRGSPLNLNGDRGGDGRWDPKRGWGWYWLSLPKSVPLPSLCASTYDYVVGLFYVISQGLNVHSHVDVYNFTDNSWGGRFDMPKQMAHSHLGMVTDGRYIYVVTGQYGPQCRGPTAHTFVLDTETKQWRDMPPLPVPRYAPATQLWRGRLHVMGGSKEDRHEPALEHWSIAVKNGKVLEKEWRTEIPIPRGGPHRACVVINDQLIVIGGQEGDFVAKPGSPIFKCSRRNEVVFDDVYMLDDEMKWKVLPSMPKPDSHIEFAWAIVNNSIVLVGGTTDKHPVTKKMILVGEVFQFNLDTLKWSVVGKLPFRVKTTLVGFWNEYLYFTSGQRDRGPDDPAPKKVLADMFRTKLKLRL